MNVRKIHMDKQLNGGSLCNKCRRHCSAGIITKKGVRMVKPGFVCPGYVSCYK